MHGSRYQAVLISSSVAVLLIGSSAGAKPPSEMAERIDRAGAVSTLHPQPSTSVKDWLAQALAQITGIQINPTESGIELFLEATNAGLAQVSTQRTENALILEIQNAQLVTGQDIRQENPAEGIESISLQSLTQDSVQLVIVTTAESAQISTSPNRLTVAVNTVAATASPEPTLKQEADTETDEAEIAEDDELEIVVTAEKTPENAQDVPLSLTVLTEQNIEDADITTLDGVADRTPNFTFFPGGSNRTSAFYSVRGVTNFNAFSRDAVGFFIDDVPYDFAGFIDQDLIDLERVEVLRGPQNTLYGRSSAGGVVNIISRRPTNDFEFKGAASYGNFDAFKTQVSVSGPIVEDRLLFRLSGSFSTQDGFVTNTLLNDDVDGGTYWTGRGQLLWTPTDEWEILLNASVADYREGADPFVLVNADDPFNTQLSLNGFNDLVTNAQSLRIAYNTSDIRVTSITAHRFSSQKAAFDQDGSIANILINAPDFSSRVISQEIRVQSPEESDRFQWILGGYFERSTFDNQRDFISGTDVPPANQGTLRSDGDSVSRSLAAFGQASYNVTDKLTLTAGLRYEDTLASIDYTQTFISPDGAFVLPVLQLNNIEISGSELLPRFAVDYRFTPNLMAYGSITRGYRPPGASFEPNDESTAVFEAETSWNYEVGLKTSWLENRLILNVSGFFNNTSNFQFPSIQNGVALVDNADIRSIGGELELIARPIEGLELSAGLGLLNSEFRNGADAFTGTALRGNRTPLTPNLTYNIAAQYRSEIGILSRLELIGVGSTFFDELNSIEQEPFVLVNVRLGYESDNYGIYLFANNLFDTRYLTQSFDFGNRIGIFGAPRTIGVQVRANF
ncbi:TonB-dependent receptor domain-containing protein [Acaryochloris marina]|uniref:TonB-dependent receptor domain-containing protein n=1 Tax=Acaryochloris marina TaxID=155978 RepID=UPI0021C3DD40|nr:TonB-dependent receptor [Acaryochloris marina]BDM77387.1 TonB-dependent receptor [Acaryochloris marina MBIC10699]